TYPTRYPLRIRASGGVMRHRSSTLAALGAAVALLVVHTKDAPRAAAAPPLHFGTVVIAGAMPEPDLIALGVATAAAVPDADFLLDTPRAKAIVRQFLDRLRPEKVVPVGAFPRGHDAWQRWGVIDQVVQPTAADPVAYAWSLFPKAERAVVAPRA